MAGDNRGSSSLFRRAEQLRRWQESETNKQDVSDKPKKRKVKFSDGCIFLAAGAAGDKEELKRLLERGADINTVNQDGITALHAACIDNNLEIVEFLVDNNADINRCDMEGWTPLHATASCGSLSMAEFLISRGADLSVVNNDGELAIDVVDEDDMAKLLQVEMDKKGGESSMIKLLRNAMKARGIDCDASRSREERRMLEDAQGWLSSGQVLDAPHPKTGATALHVAAAKGYIKVMRLLLEAGVDINTKDFDGWTPLHAAAHWGQAEAVEILCDRMADMDSLNNVGQTAYDLADDTIESLKPLMDELRRKQASAKLINNANKLLPKKRKPSPHKERSYKKEKESSKRESSSDGTSSDESSEHEEEKRSSGRVESPVDLSEVQSWRRPSLRNKILQEEKNAKEEGVRGLINTTQMNHKDTEVVLRKNSTQKDDRKMPRQKALSCLILNSSPIGGEEGINTQGRKEGEGKGEPVTLSHTNPSEKSRFDYLNLKDYHEPVYDNNVSTIVINSSSCSKLPLVSSSTLLSSPTTLSITSVTPTVATSVTATLTATNTLTSPTITISVLSEIPNTSISNSISSQPSFTKSSPTHLTLSDPGLRRANSLCENINNSNYKKENNNNRTSYSSIYSTRNTIFDASRNLLNSSTNNISPTSSSQQSIYTTPTNCSDAKHHVNNVVFSNRNNYYPLPFSSKPLVKSSSLTSSYNNNTGSPAFPSSSLTSSLDTNTTNKNSEVLLRSLSLKARLQRNCQDSLRVSDNHVTTTSSSIISNFPTKHVNSTSSLTPNGGLSSVPSLAKKSPSSTPSSTPTSPTIPTINLTPVESPTTTPEGGVVQQFASKLSAGSVIKNFFNLLHSSRSFAPPSRDEESETQRKAHAKMVRSTRRSTQGITLEDVKSAEQLMKNKTSAPTNSSSTNTTTTPSASATIEILSANSVHNTTMAPSNSSTSTTATTASNDDSSDLVNGDEKDESKRPSWRLKVDNVDKNRFSLEDVRPKAKERADLDAQVTNVSLPLKKKSTTEEKKDEKLEDKSSTTREGTQAVIQRRKKAKRRSTGVVHVDLDEIDPDRKSDKRSSDDEGGADDLSTSDRDSVSKTTSHSSSRGGSRGPSGHNGDIDYKKLYEEQLAENDKLMERLRDHEKELRHAKEVIDNNSKTASARSSLAESERREKRALERKLSEMEEELRQLQKLKAENEKLRAENRALTRVVSKLTNSAAGSMGGQLSALSRPK